MGPGAISGQAAETLIVTSNAASVRIHDAGARGLTERQVSPFDDARLHAWCHLRGDERAFWLTSIQAAALVD